MIFNLYIGLGFTCVVIFDAILFSITSVHEIGLVMYAVGAFAPVIIYGVGLKILIRFIDRILAVEPCYWSIIEIKDQVLP